MSEQLSQNYSINNLTWNLFYQPFLQLANATVTPDSAVSTWNCLSFPVAYQAEFVSDVDMQRQDEIAITAERVSIVIQRSQ